MHRGVDQASGQHLAVSGPNEQTVPICVDSEAPTLHAQLDVDDLLAGLIVEMQQVIIEEDVESAVEWVGRAVVNGDVLS